MYEQKAGHGVISFLRLLGIFKDAFVSWMLYSGPSREETHASIMFLIYSSLKKETKYLQPHVIFTDHSTDRQRGLKTMRAVTNIGLDQKNRTTSAHHYQQSKLLRASLRQDGCADILRDDFH